MIILKLIIITLFLYFSFKSLGLILSEKMKVKKDVALGIGYLLNIAIFFVCILLVMFFKLSSLWLMILGTIYFISCLISIIISIKKKELFTFSKKELLALGFALTFTILYALFLDFGYAEMYDSYFYSILTNSATTANHISKINPYTGIGDLQNFYKYISYYYQSSYLANIFNIKPAYLVLIWPFTFMNYFFMAISSLSIVRFSKSKAVNNLLTIFVLTFYTSIFRAPFNALHLVNIIIPIYMIKYMLASFEDKKSIIIYYILFTGAAACSSAILYVSAASILLLFIVNCLNKKADFNIIFKLALPTYILGFLFILEGNRNLLLISISIFVLVFIYFILKFKLVNIILKYVGLFLLLVVPTIFIIAPKIDGFSDYVMMFINQGVVDDKNVTTAENLCLQDTIKVKDLDVEKDLNNYGTAMKYIYENKSSSINTILILITHSVFMYGGMLFLLLYGIFKLREKQEFKALLVYLVLFFNPLVTEGLALLTLDLNSRIYLYFNTFFALCGLKYFFDYMKNFNLKWFENLVKYAYIPYIALFILSTASYIMLLKVPDWKEYNFLYKVPNNFVDSSKKIDSLIDHYNEENDKKPNVLYTIDTFNLSMIDINPNNEYKVIDSKEYKSYYFNPDIINNKMLLNLYFDSNGKYTYDSLKDNIIKTKGKVRKDKCDIVTMLKEYNIKFIVISKNQKNAVDYLNQNYNVVYDKNDIIVLEEVNAK